MECISTHCLIQRGPFLDTGFTNQPEFAFFMDYFYLVLVKYKGCNSVQSTTK